MADPAPVQLSWGIANAADAAPLAELRNRVAERLTREFGRGHWSGQCTERGVLHTLRTATVLVAREAGAIVATLSLGQRKPWAIDTAHFSAVRRALYLCDMAVCPRRQRQGIGRALLAQAVEHTRGWPAEAIRLDAYDAPAGAGTFYARCGFTEVGRVIYRSVPLIYYELVLGSDRRAGPEAS